MRRTSRALSAIAVAALLAAGLPMNTASARILTPPSAPRQVVVGNPTAVSLDVSWAAPLSNGGSAVTDYTLSYRKQGDASWTEYAHTASAATSRTVTGLADTSNYEFRIAAVNTNGTGPWSTSYVTMSLGDLSTCGVTSGGPANCWGDSAWNNNAALANLDGSAPNKTIESLALGLRGGCAVLADGSASCWGWNNALQLGNGTSGPESWTPGQVLGLDGSSPDKTVVKFSSGLPSCVILDDGSTRCWGINYNGQLGNGTTTNSNVPVQVTGLDGTAPDKTPIDISQRGATTCAVMQDGSAACWGSNRYGQLGDGTTNDRQTPTPVSGIDGLTPETSAVSIGVLSSTTCALFEDGSVKCWGYNGQSQLGNTSGQDQRTPIMVTGLDGSSPGSAAVALSVASGGTCVLLADGATKCWGMILDNSPGWANTTTASIPTLIGSLDGSSPDKTALNLKSGFAHTCALLADSSMKCWGRNSDRQLGDGTDTYSLSPVSVLEPPGVFASTAEPLGATSRVVTSRATSTSLAVAWNAPRESGGFPITNYRVRYRKLGGLSWSEFVHPVSASLSLVVTGLLPETSYEFQVAAVTVLGTGPWVSDYVSASAGSASSCAVRVDGAVECWGADDHGALGNGGGDASRTPVPVVGIDGLEKATTAVSIGSGDDYSCAQMENNTVKCWGQNQDGQLGNGSNVDSSLPVRVIGLDSENPATSLGIGASHACAIVDEGSYATVCWGKNDHGQLGDGGTSSQSTPLEVLEGEGYFDSLGAGTSASCATEFGYVKCWGLNDVGQLGDGTTTNSLEGVYVPLFDWETEDTTARSVTSAGSTACVMSNAGTVWCWGYGLQGGLGNGATQNSSVPVRVRGIDGLTSQTTAKQISSGGTSSCAVTNAGAVKCWGANDQGQLGNNSSANSATPVTVSGLDGSTLARSATSVAVSVSGFACATLAVGGLACWGDNSSGQLGDGTLTDRRTPVGVVRVVGTTLVGAPPASAPGAPRNLAVAVRLAETIGLAWDAPATNGGARITGYEVRWARGAQQPDAANLLEVPGDQLSARVSGLLPGISYTFLVRAVNSVSTGPTVRITAIVPVEAPAPVVTKATWNNRKITLTWLGVKTPSHSPVLNYVLTCEAANVIFRQSVNASARSASVVVDSDRRHGCRVSAVTDAGRGAGSDRVIVSPNS